MSIKFKRVSTVLEQFDKNEPINKSELIKERTKDINDPEIELGEGSVVRYVEPICPLCQSRDISKNGTYVKILENRTVIKIQKYKCNDCGKTFEVRLKGYGYKKHISEETIKQGIRTRVNTSLRKASKFLKIIGKKIVSHEFLRRIIPHRKDPEGESSRYFVYDEQYVSINGVRRFRALMKDVYKGFFYEEILDDLEEGSIKAFMVRALDKAQIEKGATITITTDGWHYDNIIREVSRIKSIHIRRSRCLVHILRELGNKIEKSKHKDELINAKDLATVMFFPIDENIENLEKNKDFVKNNIKGKSEREIVETMKNIIENLYGEHRIIQKFLEQINKRRKEIFLYLEDPAVPKTTNKAEGHFSVQSWLFKRRFKTKEGLLNTSYWYHTLSTEI